MKLPTKEVIAACNLIEQLLQRKRLLIKILIIIYSVHVRCIVTCVQTVPGCFFSYRLLSAQDDCRTLLSDLSFCPHCMVVLRPASESATLASSYSFNQHFSPHRQPQPAVSRTLMSWESQARPSCTSCCSFFFLLFTPQQSGRIHCTAKLLPVRYIVHARLADRVEVILKVLNVTILYYCLVIFDILFDREVSYW